MGGSWTNVGSLSISSTPPLNTYTDSTSGDDKRFYRLQINDEESQKKHYSAFLI